MPSPTLSTNDLARLLDINVSTVKRWADSGQLACIRTPGGHRRFRLEDVHEFLSAKGFDPRSLQPLMEAHQSLNELEEAVRHRRWDWLRQHITSLALEGDIREIVKLFVACHLSGIQPAHLSDNLICSIVKHIDGQYTTRKISAADRNLVTRVLSFALAEMRTHWQPLRMQNLRVVCGSLSNGYHELPAQCLCLVMNSEGLRTFPLGSGLPVDSFIAAVERIRPDLACLCLFHSEEHAMGRADWERLASAVSDVGGRLAVGGPGAESFGDALAPALPVFRNMQEAIAYIHRTFPAIQGDDSKQE